MKTKTLLKSALLLLPLTVAIAISQGPEQQNAMASCQQQLVVAESGTETLQLQCDGTQQQSWLGWAQGHSRSTQFHFIDLLELLNRLHSHQDSE